MGMKKFYTNLGAREMGAKGAATPKRMAQLFDMLLFDLIEKVSMKAKAVAATMIAGKYTTLSPP